jgi:hypothetical protein
MPHLAPAPRSDAATEDADGNTLLDRLERQAAELGRLQGRTSSLERALRAERDARRRIATTLQREREEAAALRERAEHESAAHASAAAELERLRQAVVLSEQQTRLIWMQLTESERQLARQSRPLWRKLLGRPAHEPVPAQDPS